MKETIFLIAFSFCIISCNQNQGNKSNQTLTPNTMELKDSLTAWDLDFALEFINGYVEFCNNSDNSVGIAEWVNSSKLVTADFKKELTKMLDKAYKEDPEMGLGFDPIFDAQDYPSEGFELLSLDPVSNLIYMRGIEWDEFELTLRAKSVDGKWLVDGCGAINVPEEDRDLR